MKALQWFGLVAVFFLAGSLFAGVQRAYGPTPVALAALAALGMAAALANPEAKQIGAWIREALNDIHLSPKAAAISIDMDLGQASRQLAGIENPNLARWSELGARFLDAFAIQILRSHGNHTVIENGLLARAVNKLEDFIQAEQSRRIA